MQGTDGFCGSWKALVVVVVVILELHNQAKKEPKDFLETLKPTKQFQISNFQLSVS